MYSSLITRDPLDIFLSARVNFIKTGEFDNFSDINKGCAQINGFYQDIFDSVNNANYSYAQVPVVHYKDLLSDRFKTIWDTLPVPIRKSYMPNSIKAIINGVDVECMAKHRLNKGELSRDKSNLTIEETDILTNTLRCFREKLVYL